MNRDNIGSNNGLALYQCRAIIWTNADIDETSKDVSQVEKAKVEKTKHTAWSRNHSSTCLLALVS